MKRLTYSLIIVILFFGCDQKNKLSNINPDNLSIDLTLKSSPKISFGYLHESRRISSFNEKLPKYYQSQLELLSIKDKDSVIIATLNTDYNQFYYQMYKKGFINKDQFLAKGIDSLVEVNKPNQIQLLASIKFQGETQTLIIDDNYNGDFSDDKVVTFDKDFRIDANDSLKIKSLPILNFEYWNYKDSQIDTFKRKVIVYPSLNYFTFSSTENEVLKKSRLVLHLMDYWSGSLETENQKYDVAIQGLKNSYLKILIKPDSLNFSPKSYVFNNNFSYQIKDSIELDNKIYVIDSITNDVSKLILKHIPSKKNIYGFRTGQKVESVILNDLSGNKINLSEIIKNKPFTIIDFWGTWCKPCIEEIPNLKKFYKTYSKDINLVSIAFDKDVEKVKNYTASNAMDWQHFFADRLNRSNKGGIMNNLHIKEFPTLILLDANQKIIYRGSGSESLDEIKEILKLK